MTGARRSLFRVLAIGAGAVLALAACSSNNNNNTNSTDTGGTYKWGIDAELSGTLSFYGQSISDGVNAYVDQVNAGGGINGHKIEVTSLDNAGDQSRAAANATQLATVNQVNAIFGHTLSANCSAAQPIAERYKIPMACLSIAAASPWLYALGPDNTRSADALFATAKKVSNKANPKVAFVYLNTLTDIALSKTIAAKASGAGITLATSQQLDLTKPDVNSQVAQVVSSAPDVVLISTTGPSMLSVLKGVRAGSVNAPFVWLDGTSNLGSLAQSTDEGVYAFNVWQQADPASTDTGVKEFISAITPKLKNGVTATTLNGGEYITGYATARAFGEALKTCGYPCSGEKLKGELDKVSLALPGLLPSFAYSAGDHYPYKNWYVYHVVGTKTTLIDTQPASASS
jgi:ABC-type branched-subunit amino acid transport system substrate-binding protein